jgi:hypothetical protein
MYRNESMREGDVVVTHASTNSFQPRFTDFYFRVTRTY